MLALTHLYQSRISLSLTAALALCTMAICGLPAPVLGAETSGVLPETVSNWPAFRGPYGSGFAPREQVVTEWDEETGKNILWKVPVPLDGASSPVVWGERVFVTAADRETRRVLCYDADTGERLWARGYGDTGANNDIRVDYSYQFAACTPVVDGEHVLANFANGDLVCMDFQGNELWAKNLGDTSGNMYGHASSLALYKDSVIVQIDFGMGVQVMAFDVETGEELWRTDNGGASWASPVVIYPEGGRPQVVVAADPMSAGYDAETGQTLWQAELIAGDIAPSPVFAQGKAIVMFAFYGMHAIDPASRGELEPGETAWTLEELEEGVLPETVSPATDGRYVYVFVADVLACVDAATGKVVYEKLVDTYSTYSSPIVAGDVLFLLGDEQTLAVRGGPEFKVIGTGTIEEYCDSTPACVGRRLYIRTENSLYCIGPEAGKRTVRILPLGDSITQGGRTDRPEYTYRYPLFCRLTDAGVKFDFIGSMTTGLHKDFEWPDYKGVPFERDHQGHYGWKTAKVRDNLCEWMKTYPAPPDIALIHLGTNDQKAEDYTEAIVEPLRDIIEMLRQANPRVVVLVGHLNFNGGAALKIRPLVEKMAEEMNTEQSPVVTVHHYRGWEERPDQPDTDTFDWAHPNPKGQEKMAQKWFEAMKPYLESLQ